MVRTVALSLLLLSAAAATGGDVAPDGGNESRRRLHYVEACVGGQACDAAEVLGCVTDDGCAADRAKCEAAGDMCTYSGPAPGGAGPEIPPPPPPPPPADPACETLCGNARKASRGNCLLCTGKAPAGTCADADLFCGGQTSTPSPPSPPNHSLLPASPCDDYVRLNKCGSHGGCVLTHTEQAECMVSIFMYSCTGITDRFSGAFFDRRNVELTA